MTNKNHLFFIPLLFIIIACSAGHNSPANNPGQSGNYSFDKLITHNSFYTPPSESECPDIPINRDPNLQLPQAKCELSNSPAQIAYGCDVNMANPHSLGAKLAQSVVGIAIPISKESWELGCTGTVIESKWVLTAAHCVANKWYGADIQFEPDIQNLVVVPWQDAYRGVPNSFNSESINIIKFLIKSIYIPYNYNSHQESNASLYNNGSFQDFALLELESSLPSFYQPIMIESAALNLPLYTPLWSAGYGRSESQAPDEPLHYRDAYYYSNRYNILSGNPSQQGPVLGNNGVNYGMIYTLGSIPESTESQPRSAWSFLGPGDSGGPLLYYNSDKQKFSILATLTGGLYCQYAGFYAPLPYSFDQYTAMTESRNTLIQQIINKTANRAEVRCISKDDSCFLGNIYVLNSNNTMSEYNIQNDNMQFIKNIATGLNPKALTFSQTADHKYILVANEGSGSTGSVSIFSQNINGVTTTANPAQYTTGIDHPVDILSRSIFTQDIQVSIAGSNIYIANQGGKITKLKLSYNGLAFESSIIIPGASINKIKFMDPKLYVIDTLSNKIYIIFNMINYNESITENLNAPTDLLFSYPTNIWIANSGNDTILFKAAGYLGYSKIYDSNGNKPNQIIEYNVRDSFGNLKWFIYLTNLNSNNISIFWLYGDTLNFIKTVDTGKMPISMTITGSQLYVVNKSDNTLWQYNILSSGDLQFKESAATGLGPIAVLADKE